MPIGVLGIPACDIMPEEDAHQPAPLAEPDTELDAEADMDQTGLYELWPREPDGSPTGFDADQLQQLYLQLSHHCQLMIEMYALTACNSEHQEAAVTVASLLAEYQVDALSSLLLKVKRIVLGLLLQESVMAAPSFPPCRVSNLLARRALSILLSVTLINSVDSLEFGHAF